MGTNRKFEGRARRGPRDKRNQIGVKRRPAKPVKNIIASAKGKPYRKTDEESHR